MGSSDFPNPVSTVRLSSVVPATMTGEDKDRQLTDTDLAMKLHYVKGVYFFERQAVEGLSMYDMKKPMFRLLEIYYTASGRIRRSPENGRPFVKCNDGGVRIVEAFCDKTVDEWLAKTDDCRDICLVYDEVLGPDLGFSPLVYLQFTWFKCGGMSLGLTWAHVLGDPISASTFVNTWAQIMDDHVTAKCPNLPSSAKNNAPDSNSSTRYGPFKTVDSVGDRWQIPNNYDMKTQSFHISPKIINQILSNSQTKNPSVISHFDVISAIFLKAISKIREDSSPRIVTICTYDAKHREQKISNNNMRLRTMKMDINDIVGNGVYELSTLIGDSYTYQDHVVHGKRNGHSKNDDLIMYGANLTIVNMENASIYGLKLKGFKPKFANYTIDGVGDEGVVFVLPGLEEEGNFGRMVTVVLPERELILLKNEIRNNLGIV